MPPIRMQHVVSYTSEDPKHNAENLITGNGMWLCKLSDPTGTISVEFQLQKATSINYIDIGNCNSATIRVEVGMSSWHVNEQFGTLLPTVMLMTPAECRSGQNAKCVKMFKKENFDEENASKKWDRVRVVCSQQFMRNSQYGLAFFKLYALEETSYENIEIWDHPEIKKRDFFLNSSLPSKSPSLRLSDSLLSLENGKINNNTETNSLSSGYPVRNKITSPISRAGRLVMARRHVPNEMDGKLQRKQLECEALAFLISMNLTTEDIHSLKVSHIREEFEIRRKSSLSTRQKIIFKNIALDYATERLNRIESEGKHNELNPVLLSDDDDSSNALPEKTANKYSLKRAPGTPVSNSSSKIRKEDPLTSTCDSVCKSRNDLSLADAIVTGSTPTLMTDKKRTLNDHGFEESVVASNRCNKSRKIEGGSPVYISDNDIELVSSSPEGDFCSLEGAGHSSGWKSTKKKTLYTNNEKGPTSDLDLVECPICTDLFSTESIEEHAASCNSDSNPSVHQNIQEHEEECPICGNRFPQSQLEQHGEVCADRTFS